jgi:hypothetical protein
VNEIQTDTTEYCPAYNTNFGSNFAYQVQMTILQGDLAGLIVRDDTHHISYYFRLAQNGQYNLVYYKGTSKISAGTLAAGRAPSFNTGYGQANLIQVSITSDNIALYVNNQFLQNVSIGTYGFGYIGVFVKDLQNPTEAQFSNAKVWNF